jgi:peptidyl-prolyl cis-trans isomerase C
MKFRTLLATSACLVFATTATFAQDTPSADTVLATVNGVNITVGHVIALTNRLPEQYKSIPDKDLYEGVLDQLIHQTAISTTANADTKSMKLAIENEIRALLAGETLDKIGNAAKTEDKVKAAYEEKYLNLPRETEYKAAHILVKTEDEAKELLKALEGGADFAELAKEKSTGPSGVRGGDLGWFTPDKMIPEFGNVVKTMKTGTISAPVKTQFGWHVIKLHESRDVAPPTLEEVRTTIESDLKDAALKEAIDAFQKDAKITRNEVEIDPSIIRKTDLLK